MLKGRGVRAVVSHFALSANMEEEGGRRRVWSVVTPVLVQDCRFALGPTLRRASRTLRRPGLLLQLFDAEGCAVETTPLHEAFPEMVLPRQSVTVVLAGEYASRECGPMREGGIALEVRQRWDERWAGRRQRFVTLCW